MRCTMKKRTHNRTKWKIAKKLILILGFFFVVSGCQKKEKEEESSVPLPEVAYKFSQDEVVDFHNRTLTDDTARYEGLTISKKPMLVKPEELPKSLFYDSGIDIPYPEDGVKGLYLTAENVSDPNYFQQIIDFIDQTDLNAVVIDFKDDYGQIIPANDSLNPLVQENTVATVDYKAILQTLQEHQIYPIARITSFKDNMLADAHSEMSFIDPETNEVWQDANGAKFINPFMADTQNYVIDVAIEAAKMGFKDVQFDYVRFPEGFFEWSDTLQYDLGDFASFVSDDPDKSGSERVQAINQFLALAKERLSPYGVDVSADIFGYTTIAGDTFDVRGIGQNIAQMAENVDVVSAMIYPSHWGPGFFNLDAPDLYPYEVVDNYIFAESKIFAGIQNKVTSRPWLQDFTDYALPAGSYQEYGPDQVQSQVNALAANGVHEFLLWNAMGEYSQGVDYSPQVDENGQVTSNHPAQETADTGNQTITAQDEELLEGNSEGNY